MSEEVAVLLSPPLHLGMIYSEAIVMSVGRRTVSFWFQRHPSTAANPPNMFARPGCPSPGKPCGSPYNSVTGSVNPPKGIALVAQNPDILGGLTRAV